jgi:hypothetical protein
MAREQRREQQGEPDEKDLHSRIFEVLLDKARGDQFPSTTHLDMLEQMLRDQDEVDEYCNVLMDKVGSESFPSFDHLKRLQNFA